MLYKGLCFLKIQIHAYRKKYIRNLLFIAIAYPTLKEYSNINLMVLGIMSNLNSLQINHS